MRRIGLFPVAFGLFLVAIITFIVWLQLREKPDKAIVSVHRGPPVTQAECLEFGKQLERAVHAGNTKAIDRLLQMDDLAIRVLDTVRFSPQSREKTLKMIGAKPNATAQNLVKIVKDGGKFTFLRAATENDFPRVLFRLVPPSRGFNYLEVYPARHSSGEIVADDLYFFVLGERLSQTLRRPLIKLASVEELRQLTPLERMEAANGAKLEAMFSALQEGRNRDAYDIFATLPRELKKTRHTQVMAITGAREVGDREYLEILEDFRRDHPGDAALDLISFDYFFLKRNFNEARVCLNNIDRSVGGDPYLSFLRARILAQEGQNREAGLELEKAIAACPDHDEILWDRVMLAAVEKNHDETRDWLKKAVTQFEIRIDEETLRPYAALEPFLKSPQYQELLKWQQAREKRG